MSENIVLDMLRAMRGDLATLKGDMGELKERLGFLEAGYASLSRPVDRVGGDIGRISRRLEITGAHA